MARIFRRRQSPPPIADLNVIPLIDLAFSLLIIFMIATPLIQNERSLPVDLPVSTEAPSRSPDARYAEVVIVPGGYQLDGQLVNREQLESNLRVMAASPNPPAISIRADRGIIYQEVVTVLDILTRNNLTKIHLDTQTSR